MTCPAAFRRLCVETYPKQQHYVNNCQPPLGGCVLKHPAYHCLTIVTIPAAFRRLCVETTDNCLPTASSTPAAFRRLCVETQTVSMTTKSTASSRL